MVLDSLRDFSQFFGVLLIKFLLDGIILVLSPLIYLIYMIIQSRNASVGPPTFSPTDIPKSMNKPQNNNDTIITTINTTNTSASVNSPKQQQTSNEQKHFENNNNNNNNFTRKNNCFGICSPFRRKKFHSIFITGATSGIGYETAIQLSKQTDISSKNDNIQKIHLFLMGRTLSKLEKIKQECEENGAIVYIFVGDVRDSFGLSKILLKCDNICPIDLIFANAGVSALNTQRRDFSGKFFELLEINILGTLNTVFPLLPRLITRQNGHIAINGSMTSYSNFATAITAYPSTKVFLRFFAEIMRLSLRHYNVDVTIINAGYIKTEIIKNSLKIKGDNRYKNAMNVTDACKLIINGLKRNLYSIDFPMSMFSYALWASGLHPIVRITMGYFGVSKKVTHNALVKRGFDAQKELSKLSQQRQVYEKSKTNNNNDDNNNNEMTTTAINNDIENTHENINKAMNIYDNNLTNNNNKNNKEDNDNKENNMDNVVIPSDEDLMLLSSTDNNNNNHNNKDRFPAISPSPDAIIITKDDLNKKNNNNNDENKQITKGENIVVASNNNNNNNKKKNDNEQDRKDTERYDTERRDEVGPMINFMTDGRATSIGSHLDQITPQASIDDLRLNLNNGNSDGNDNNYNDKIMNKPEYSIQISGMEPPMQFQRSETEFLTPNNHNTQYNNNNNNNNDKITSNNNYNENIRHAQQMVAHMSLSNLKNNARRGSGVGGRNNLRSQNRRLSAFDRYTNNNYYNNNNNNNNAYYSNVADSLQSMYDLNYAQSYEVLANKRPSKSISPHWGIPGPNGSANNSNTIISSDDLSNEAIQKAVTFVQGLTASSMDIV